MGPVPILILRWACSACRLIHCVRLFIPHSISILKQSMPEPSVPPTVQASWGSFDFGWPFNIHASGIDPYVHMEYRHIDINAFSENSVYTGGSRIGTAAGYGFSYGGQSLKSVDGALGLKFRYTFTPKFGVIVPYVKAELHHNFDTDPFTVSAAYAGLNAASSGAGIRVTQRHAG